MTDEMNIPDEMKEKIFEILMVKVPPEKMSEAIDFLIERTKEQKNDEDMYATIVGVLYGILGYGYYLGGYDAVEAMVDMTTKAENN
jgi:hypothetical protein